MIKKMTKEEYHIYIWSQKKAIEDYKWQESEKMGYDLGNNCCIEWIATNGKDFRHQWQEDIDFRNMWRKKYMDSNIKWTEEELCNLF